MCAEMAVEAEESGLELSTAKLASRILQIKSLL